MPFLTVAILKRQLGKRFVESFDANNPTVFVRQLIPQADRVVTRLTGIQPPSTPVEEPDDTSDDVQIQMYAAWIVHFLMIPLQGGVSAEEYRNRERNYDRATKELPMYGGGSVGPDYEGLGSEYKSTKRIGDMP